MLFCFCSENQILRQIYFLQSFTVPVFFSPVLSVRLVLSHRRAWKHTRSELRNTDTRQRMDQSLNPCSNNNQNTCSSAPQKQSGLWVREPEGLHRERGYLSMALLKLSADIFDLFVVSLECLCSPLHEKPPNFARRSRTNRSDGGTTASAWSLKMWKFITNHLRIWRPSKFALNGARILKIKVLYI